MKRATKKRNEHEREYARAERISERTTQRRNVICCLRKTIEGSVAAGGRTRVLPMIRTRIIRTGPSSPAEVRGLSLSRRAGVVGETISIVPVVALMFYEDTYAFLRSVESQFVWENRTLFPLALAPANVLSFPVAIPSFSPTS